MCVPYTGIDCQPGDTEQERQGKRSVYQDAAGSITPETDSLFDIKTHARIPRRSRKNIGTSYGK
jgi:hypothetical protein